MCRLRHLSYGYTIIFLICFAINNSSSLQNAIAKAQKVANLIVADGYVEISSRTGYNIYVPFEKGINAVLIGFRT